MIKKYLTPQLKNHHGLKKAIYCERFQNTTHKIFEVLKFSFQYLKLESLKQVRDL